ncbi:hypothetical protein EBE87_04920 [Pseudoroseomonas wenyumeiae]|uniref:Peptidase C39-like domain-containing protein n=1 Tax=Teichococcus wenyumeiae TaxID=2478470 RepID=A0A3A9JDB5_9PROT|nr:hypothetical protein [Pseudoroseomonas wenyumeiae]RKK03401.1 hypothetical protein D6Z83_14700 [Pseudoroseomonas wenyumeiae]RMI26610.1 hypothetical protein EBE87_04920 [Pseudoroseomonas wenyumeiae]
MSVTTRKIPYFSQWESPDLTAAVVAEGAAVALARDPLWRGSGAADLAEYVHWADHVCGMACLKMILAARTGHAPPTLELARGCTEAGGYLPQPDGGIKGLIYAPFTRFVAERYGMKAEVVVGIEAGDLPGILRQAEFFMASVHPAIRWPERPAPGQGGHLVLVHAASAEAVVFHNPSGHDAAARQDVALPPEVFGRFFAGRGIAIHP